MVWLLLVALLWVALYTIARKFRVDTSVAAALAGDSESSARIPFYRQPILAESIAATGLLALVTAGFFWQILFTSNSWMPAGGGDLAPFLYPNYKFAASHLSQGNLPLWNPHLYSGTPFAADIQAGLFYPINLLLFLLRPDFSYEALEYLAVFHFWLAGVTMYLCLRLLFKAPSALSPLAAFAGALIFEFSDLFIVHFGNLNMIAVAAWLPLIFLLFHHSLQRSSPGLAAASGVVVAVATLAGHIQITLFIFLTLGLLALWHIAERWQCHTPPTGWSEVVQPLVALATVLLVTVGLIALLLLPAYEMSQYTPRAELPYREAARYSLHPAQLAGLLIPNYFGRDPALHWGPWERVETGYIGLMPLFLALLGLLLSPKRLKFFFLGLGLIALLLALGGYSVLHGWLYSAVPGFNQLRAPARFILLLDFSLAALAAMGLQPLLSAPLSGKSAARLFGTLRVLTWIIGGLLVVTIPLSYFALLITEDRNPIIFNRAAAAASGVMLFALFSIAALLVLWAISKEWLRSWGAGLAVITVIGLDLFTLGHGVDVGHTNPLSGYEHPAALTFLQNDPNLFRTEVTTDVWHAWQPNTAMLNNLYDAWGLYNPLTLADTTLYWSGAPPRSSGRYNFLGIKYIIAGKGGAPADGDIVPIFDADPQINIYLNQSALPRVLFVGRSQVVANHDDAWQAIRMADFDPASLVILEGGQSLNNQPQSKVVIRQYGIEQAGFTITTDQAGYLVLADAWYPGWQATVDGQPSPIERANYAFRAVYIPPGEHTVLLEFKPVIWTIGWMISALTVLLLAGWAIWRWRKFSQQQT